MAVVDGGSGGFISFVFLWFHGGTSYKVQALFAETGRTDNDLWQFALLFRICYLMCFWMNVYMCESVRQRQKIYSCALWISACIPRCT